MKVVRAVIGAVALLLLTPTAADADTGTISDPAGDVVVESGESEGVDVADVTIKNGAKTITVSLAFHNVTEEDQTGDGFYPAMDTTVIMKWGTGSKKQCTFADTVVGPEGQCHGDPPPMTACGSITDGAVQVIKIPRKCVGKAADTLRFKTVTVHEAVCANCDENPKTTDTTAWSGRIRRG